MRQSVGPSDVTASDFVGGIAQMDYIPAKNVKRTV